jgi:hypothetical protein
MTHARIDWEEICEGYGPLHKLEEHILASLKKLVAETNAPTGALPYMLRHLHRQLEIEAREEAKTIQLKMAMPPDQEATFMEAYPELLAKAKQFGFEEAGQWFAYCTLMGLSNPLSPEEFEFEEGGDDDEQQQHAGGV